jgi:hypothetical protein
MNRCRLLNSRIALPRLPLSDGACSTEMTLSCGGSAEYGRSNRSNTFMLVNILWRRNDEQLCRTALVTADARARASPSGRPLAIRCMMRLEEAQ